MNPITLSFIDNKYYIELYYLCNVGDKGEENRQMQYSPGDLAARYDWITTCTYYTCR